MNKVIYFKNGRALSVMTPNQEQMDKIKNFPHLIDPDESQVAGFPQSEWRLFEGKLVPAHSAFKQFNKEYLAVLEKEVTKYKSAMKAIQQSLESAYGALAQSRIHARVALILGITSGLIVGYCVAAITFYH